MTQFTHLFSPLTVGSTTIKNRILSTGHQTNFVHDGVPTADFIAYHEARAKGGIGLIVLEAGAVHETGLATQHSITSFDARIVPAYKTLMEKVNPYGTAIFAQLSHSGREIVSSDYRIASVAPSAVPSPRFGTMPRALLKAEIQDIVAGFARSAAFAKEGGLHGVELVCSHGYLPSQFWNPMTNFRDDEYGGSFENRMRFVVEVIQAIWAEVGEDFTVGMRISADELIFDGLTEQDTAQIVTYIAEQVRLDYINVTVGNSSTYAGSTHIVPPSPMKQGYNANRSFTLRMETALPTFVGSRIIDPVQAEKIIRTGQADMVGMTRANIVDPNMPNKALHGELQKIDACIGCLQACIGHYHKGLGISCVQNPQAGKETYFTPLLARRHLNKRVLVIGAGPGGLEAAISADAQGHHVTLVEKSNKIGGALNLMRLAANREEMATSMLDNYTRQLALSQVDVRVGTILSPAEIEAFGADAIICATGSKPYLPAHLPHTDPRVVSIDDLFISKEAFAGKAVIFDFKGDWSALEAALHLAEKGCEVTLYTTRLYVGEDVHQYLRNEYMKKLYAANITMVTHHEFGGVSAEGITVRNLFTQETHFTEADHIVLALGRVATDDLYAQIQHAAPFVTKIGDCLAPRTIEEATLEGLEAAVLIEEKVQNILQNS